MRASSSRTSTDSARPSRTSSSGRRSTWISPRGGEPSCIFRSGPSSRSWAAATPIGACRRSPTISRSRHRWATSRRRSLPRAGRRPRGDAARLRGGCAALRSRAPAARDGSRGRRPAALRPAPATRRCPVAGGRRRRRALELRGRDSGRPPSRGGRAARPRGARLRDGPRRLPALRALRGRSDGRRPAHRGAGCASRRRQLSPGDPALAPGARAVLGERADRDDARP